MATAICERGWADENRSSNPKLCAIEGSDGRQENHQVLRKRQQQGLSLAIPTHNPTLSHHYHKKILWTYLEAYVVFVEEHLAVVGVDVAFQILLGVPVVEARLVLVLELRALLDSTIHATVVELPEGS